MPFPEAGTALGWTIGSVLSREDVRANREGRISLYQDVLLAESMS